MDNTDRLKIAVAIGQAYAECRGAEIRGVEKVLEHIGHIMQSEDPTFKPINFVKAVERAAELSR